VASTQLWRERYRPINYKNETIISIAFTGVSRTVLQIKPSEFPVNVPIHPSVSKLQLRYQIGNGGPLYTTGDIPYTKILDHVYSTNAISPSLISPSDDLWDENFDTKTFVVETREWPEGISMSIELMKTDSRYHNEDEPRLYIQRVFLVDSYNTIYDIALVEKAAESLEEDTDTY
jgi:hypothetical protein